MAIVAQTLRIFAADTDTLAIDTLTQIVTILDLIAVLMIQAISSDLTRTVLDLNALLAPKEATPLRRTVSVKQTCVLLGMAHSAFAYRIRKIVVAVLVAFAVRVLDALAVYNVQSPCDSKHSH